MNGFFKQFGASLSVIAVLLACGFCLVQFLNAKTTVTQNPDDECKFTVTVDLAFAFDDSSYDNADALIQTWVSGMNDVWNGEDGAGQTFGECDCEVKFVFNIEKIKKGKNCTDAPAGYHCMYVVDRPVNQRGNIADAHEVPPDGSMNGFGEWTVGTTGLQAAHEAGHLMGLSDGYHFEDTDGDGQPDSYVNDNPQVPGPQGIMSQTWGDTGVLQEYIDEIMNDAGMTCPDSCCCGNGKVDGEPVNEQCDPKAEPTGCEEDELCVEDCTCVPREKPVCGDGKVNGFEMCDPKAEPTGCEQGEKCVNCICFKPEELAPPAETPAPVVPAEEEEVPAEEVEEEINEEPVVPEAEEAGPVCGDGSCDEGEDCNICQDDCGDCPSVCGDGLCDNGEDCESCPDDCGECGPICGDGVCEPVVEDCYLCEVDCGTCKFKCEDGIDNDGDTLIDFPDDPGCYDFTDDDEENCGNGICEFPETYESCPIDCPIE